MCIFTHIHYIQCVRMCRCIHLVLVENLRLLNLVSDRVTRSLGRSPKQPAFALKKKSASSIIIYILCIGNSFPVWSFVVGILLAIIDTSTITRKKSPNRSRIIFWFLFGWKFVELLCRHGNCDLSDKL